MKLNINGIDKEVSKETCALAVTDYFAKHPEPKPEPPELRHGDYGINLTPWIKIWDNVWWLTDQKLPSDYDDSSFVESIQGNLVDDLARNKVDLEEFEISDEDGPLAFEAVKQCGHDTIWIQVHRNSKGFFSINQATEIHQKLGQMIATARRR